jgi:uncharacterized membrane protein YgdD (TMEM256/DUF423 family)
MSNNNTHQGLGAIMLGISIAFGALGAHILEKILTPHYLDVWKTACLYCSFNALGLLFIGSSSTIQKSEQKTPITLIIIGAFVFSVSLWIVALNKQIHPSITKLAIITPFGGLAMIAGWIWIGARLLRSKK